MPHAALNGPEDEMKQSKKKNLEETSGGHRICLKNAFNNIQRTYFPLKPCVSCQ